MSLPPERHGFLTVTITTTNLPARPPLVGVGADPEVCGWMYGYLYKTLLRLASEHMRGPARRLRSAKSKREARNSFLFGAVDVISSRMIAQKKVAPVTSDALVPVKDALIRAAMPDQFENRHSYQAV